jgi:hypothetical protein
MIIVEYGKLVSKCKFKYLKMNSSNNSIVFVSSLTNYQLNIIKPHLLQRWPGFTIYVFRIIPKYRFAFNYDNNVHPAFFPVIKFPQYTSNVKKYGLVLHITNESIKVKRHGAVNILKNADTISYLGDLWYSFIIDYDILLNECLGFHEANKERVVIVPEIFTGPAIRYALNNPITTENPQFYKLLDSGMAKRFFDYNYNINSLHFFTFCLRKIGVVKKDYNISKYSLQLLYKLHERRPMSTGKAVLMAQNWKGSRTYPASVFGIGNPHSIGSILNGLLDSGLLEKNKKELLIVSKAGKSFLEMLDPGCRDIDLPGKLQLWQENWPNSRNEIETYITNYFSNQKAFMQDSID